MGNAGGNSPGNVAGCMMGEAMSAGAGVLLGALAVSPPPTLLQCQGSRWAGHASHAWEVALQAEPWLRLAA
eukprot:CAMPEP_0174354628 /NCGR_PEP_ID=MMETSP0811_2-20130205/20870_1 /TAXON_ID=73025 ORGANISM="Eutreptiella gymnastica-like, Strain CCMP1594" /NCGR_SAMPLE_ID=MMETSP0811_2 /ASSEMBLY_ACC=CAM_ASM_000667 /LENGTH=70 /DNA_ID=CAMNT_0015485599 /DNA_START=303 /DNA_END=516 /DNA_ORIENTATION=-